MKILVVGGGGREHAIIKSLKKSSRVTELFSAPGNGGISYDATCVNISATDVQGIVDFSVENAIDYVVVTPDDPLVLGMVDALTAVGIKSFGPTKKAAQIEGSKAFSKALMKKYSIPTADYEVFDNWELAVSYLKEKNTYPTVIKADGLALGKGVLICENEADAIDAVKEMLLNNKFGKSGARIVIEEFLEGVEVSVLSFTDGKTVVPMVSSMDHKRALDGDKGLNTGGMGTIAPNPFYTKEIAEECMETIYLPTVNAMNQEDASFKGCLYFGLILTKNGAKVIEYNARFGDPETQVVLPLLETDLLEVMEAVTSQKLSDIEVSFSDKSATCVILASGGYPESYKKGVVISGLEQGAIPSSDSTIFHAGTAILNNELITAGGRVLGITSVADSLQESINQSYLAIKSIDFDGMYCRSDIGSKIK